MTDQPMHFTGQTPGGHTLTGTLAVGDPQTAQAELSALGLQPLEVQPPTAPLRKPSSMDAAAFSHQLAHLCEAGVPLPEALELIAEEAGRGRLGRAARAVAAKVRQGAGLDAAVAEHAHAFPPGYADLLAAATRAGCLPPVLLGMARHLEFEREVRRSLQRALAYPIIALAGTGGLCFLIQAVTFPGVRALFDEFNQDVPLGASLALNGMGWLALALLTLALAPVVWFALAGLSGWRGQLDLLLRVPLLGRAVRCGLAARFCDAAAVGLGAGQDLPSALQLGAAAADSPRLEADVAELCRRIKDGRDVAVGPTLRTVPPVVVLTLSMAGRGQADAAEALAHLARSQAAEAGRRAASFLAWVTPILLLTIGAMLGVILFVIYAPMLSVIQSFMRWM